MEHFVREAREKVPVHLYSAECTTTEGLTYKIVFMRNIEIGYRAFMKMAVSHLQFDLQRKQLEIFLESSQNFSQNLCMIW